MSNLSSFRIAGTGSAVPERVVTNEELAARVATTPAWIVENLGIRERRVAREDEWTSDLAARAGLNALEAAGVDREQVDLILLATSTPDRKAPSTACLAKGKMGIRNLCPAMDVSAVCSGFIYSLVLGAQAIQCRSARTVLVIGADTFSKLTDWDRRDCVFFGDGAGAVLLVPSNHPCALFTHRLYSDPKGHDCFTVFPSEKHFTMNGRAVYETGTTVLPEAIREVLKEQGLSPSDIDLVIPHQPSVRVLQKMAENLGIPFAKVRTNMERYANTAGATVPLLLDEVRRKDGIPEGALVMFAAVGAGWTWGAALYRWSM